jgi:osmoprotectant transport system ATP-binding protein
VGVARALGADPPVLLMDEPFAAVDPVTRQRLQNQFLDLQAELNKTIVFVTHDLEEAAKLGDRIAVLSKGAVLEQYDTPEEILGHPATAFVTEFVGSDRGVRRLAVVHIGVEDLAHPPVVGPTKSMAEARAASVSQRGSEVSDDDSRWAVVVGDDGVLQGWVPLDPDLEGPVIDRLTRFAVEVPLGSSMRTALAEMLQHDVSWIPVAEHGRYLGVLTPDGLHAAMRRSVGGRAVES